MVVLGVVVKPDSSGVLVVVLGGLAGTRGPSWIEVLFPNAPKPKTKTPPKLNDLIELIDNE